MTGPEPQIIGDFSLHAGGRHSVESRIAFHLRERWLIPCLVGFQRRYPEIDVHLFTTTNPADLLREDADISIHCRAGDCPGYSAQFLITNRIFPVASPGFLASSKITSADDLADMVLIRVDAPPRMANWELWLEAHNLTGLTRKAWQGYSNSTHAIEAATAGLGIAITHTTFVTDSFANGLLVTLFDQGTVDRDGDHYLVHRTAASDVTRIAKFVRWLSQPLEF